MRRVGDSWVVKWLVVPLLGFAMLIAYGCELYVLVPLLLGRDSIYSLTGSGQVIVVAGILVPLLPLILALRSRQREPLADDIAVKVIGALVLGFVLSVAFALTIVSFMIFG